MAYPREVFIRSYPNLQVTCFHTDDEGNSVADGLLQDERFHGIEKSAYDQLKSENEKLMSALDVALKLLEECGSSMVARGGPNED